MNSGINGVYNALVLNGEELTAKQISARYSLGNPYNAVYTLRMEGYPIYCNSVKNSKGKMVNKYRLGTPSREVIAAGYKALAAGLV
jgi:hypothetical protein